MSHRCDERYNFAAARAGVIESSKFAFQITRNILGGFGFRHIDGYETPEEAKSRLKVVPVDIILCDPFPHVQRMLQMLRALREPQFGETSMAPIIVTTANVGIDVIKGAKECQADFVVAKPFSPQTLLDRIVWAAKRPNRRDLALPDVLISSSSRKADVELW